MTYENITYDYKSSIGRSSSGASFNHTIGNHPNRILVVAVGAFDVGSTTQVSGVTFGGVALTLAEGNGAVERHESIWYLLNPTVSTGAIAVTLSSGGNFAAGAVSFYNVMQGSIAGESGSGVSDTIIATITPAYDHSTLVAVCVTADRSGAPYSNNTSLFSIAWSDGWKFGTAGGYVLDKTGVSSATFTTPEASYGWSVIAIAPNQVPEITTSDSVGVTESTNIVPDSQIGMEDSIAVNENSALKVITEITTSESISTNEKNDTTIRDGLQISIWKENVIAGESLDFPGPRDRFVYDSLRVGEKLFIKLNNSHESSKPSFKVDY